MKIELNNGYNIHMVYYYGLGPSMEEYRTGIIIIDMFNVA